MSDCEHAAKKAAESSAGCCDTSSPTQHTAAMAGSCCAAAGASAKATDSAGDSCCDTPAQRDYLLWGSVLTVALAYPVGAVLQHDHSSFIGIFSGGIYELFNRMWWGIAIGVVFVGILGRVPRELVMGLLGRNAGVSGLLRATMAGVLLDLCSHGILAVGMKLYERGASVGQVMAFLLASPWNSLSLTLILIGLIGIGWTLMFILLSLVIGLVTGWIFDALQQRGQLPENPWRQELGEGQPLDQMWSEFRSTISVSMSGSVQLLREGFAGSRVVIRWALFGLVLAGLIRAIVPEEAFATWFGATLGGLWLTLLATTVIEVCSEGSTPIAADLMNRAGAPGNSFTFLMAGVATDYTEIMSIRDTTRSWKIALFLPLVTVPQVILIGYVLNQFPA
tara:strand:- start:33358 stop:34536 length:1179 start_codon:yes stop_codon:yes gene_type:complete